MSSASEAALGPSLESVLLGAGSSRALAIFILEHVCATRAISGIAIGRAHCIDVDFAHAAAQWARTAEALTSAAASPAAAGVEHERALEASRRSARELFSKFIEQPSLPSASAAHAHAFPPLHVAITPQARDALAALITTAESSRSSLPASLFLNLQQAATQYLQDTYFGLFLGTLAFDHLEVESLLLGPALEARHFYRSAHSCYKEEYALFYADYKAFRGTIEEGPPAEQPSGGRAWFETVVARLDDMHRAYFRPRAEFAVYIEADVRTQLVTSLKATKKGGQLEGGLLAALLTIKDYALEVLKFDVLPAYRANAKCGHKRKKRASLLAQDSPPADAPGQPAAIMPLPVLQAPLPPRGNLEADVEALTLADTRKTPSQSPPHSPSQRRGSIVNAAVDVSSGSRRASTIAAHRGTLKARAAGLVTSNGSAPSSPAVGGHSLASATIDGEMHPTSARDSEVDADGDGEGDGDAVGPLPSSNPNLRSFSDLRARRSISGSLGTNPQITAAMAAVVAAAQQASPSWSSAPLDDDDDEKQDSAPRPSALSMTQSEFNNFNAVAAAMAQSATPSSPAPSATVASSLSTTPPAFTALHRRSVLASTASSSLVSSAAASAATAGGSADREVSFDLSPSVPSSPRVSTTAAPPPPLRSILKSRIRCETVTEALRRIFLERLGESDRHLATLQAGCLVQKYNAAGKAADRWFKVSQDGTELCWGKVDSASKVPLKAGIFNRKKKFPLADVTRVRYGSSNSRRFAQYNLSAKSKPWMAFSVYFPDKTLDLVCAHEREVDTWFRGVQALAPLSTTYLSKAAVVWRRAQMKLRYYAVWQNIEPVMFLEDLVSAARQDMPMGKLPSSPVVDLLDEQIAATPEK